MLATSEVQELIQIRHDLRKKANRLRQLNMKVPIKNRHHLFIAADKAEGASYDILWITRMEWKEEEDAGTEDLQDLSEGG